MIDAIYLVGFGGFSGDGIGWLCNGNYRTAPGCAERIDRRCGDLRFLLWLSIGSGDIKLRSLIFFALGMVFSVMVRFYGAANEE